MKSWLEKNHIGLYLPHNERKFVRAERFIRMIKIQNVNLVIMLEYENIKMILQKVTLQIDLEKFLRLKKLKSLFLGHMLIIILMEKKNFERFMKNNCKRQIKKNLELKK